MSEKISRIILFDTKKDKERPPLSDMVHMLKEKLAEVGTGLYRDEAHARELGSVSKLAGEEVNTSKIVITFEYGKMDDEKEHE